MKSLFDHGEKETTTIGAEDDVDSVWLRFVQNIVLLLLSICARVFAARRLWSCCCGTDCCLRLVSGRRALPHRVKRSQPDVGDVAVAAAAFDLVVADCGPGAAAAARSPCTLW